MPQRNTRERSNESNKPHATSKFDQQGLRPDSVHEYRGRESYEQQRDAGDGGRSGMWEQTDESERRDPSDNPLPTQRVDTDHPQRPRRAPRKH